MNELWQLGAIELSETIRRGGASERQAVEAHPTRVDAVNPRSTR